MRGAAPEIRRGNRLRRNPGLASIGKPPEGYANWTGPLVAKALGDVNVQYVWRFLRTHKIDLSGRKSWCVD